MLHISGSLIGRLFKAVRFFALKLICISSFVTLSTPAHGLTTLLFGGSCAAGTQCVFSPGAENQSVSARCASGTMTVNGSVYGANGLNRACTTYATTACSKKTSCSLTFSNTNCGGDPIYGVVKSGNLTVTCSIIVPPTPTPSPTPRPTPTPSPTPALPTIGKGIPTGPLKGSSGAIDMASALFVSPTGLDTNPGTQSKPWKTVQHGVTQLLPGQTLVLRAGRYPESVVFTKSGTTTQPIRVITGWVKCTSSAACGGVVDYAKTYYAPYTRIATDGHLVDGDKPLFRAQWPEQPHPFYKEQIEYFWKPATASGTKISITDPKNLPAIANLSGAYVYTWTLDNRIATRKITAFNRTAGKIDFAEIANIRATEEYSLFNHISFLKKPGHYVIDEAAKRIYVIPTGTAQQVRVSARKLAFNVNGQSNITIDGIKVSGYSGLAINQGLAVLNLIGKSITNLKVLNLHIIGNRAESNYA
ncbi:MAG: hypothetical protein V4692_04960, partial [Bdellovibrionota bacterium]